MPRASRVAARKALVMLDSIWSQICTYAICGYHYYTPSSAPAMEPRETKLRQLIDLDGLLLDIHHPSRGIRQSTSYIHYGQQELQRKRRGMIHQAGQDRQAR